MKCIRFRETTRIVRTSNEEAEDRVASGDWRYASKSVWRHFGGKREDPQESRMVYSIHPPRGWLNRSNQKPGWAK